MIHEKYIPRREEIIMKKVLLHCAMEKEGKQIADKLELKKKDTCSRYWMARNKI